MKRLSKRTYKISWLTSYEVMPPKVSLQSESSHFIWSNLLKVFLKLKLNRKGRRQEIARRKTRRAKKYRSPNLQSLQCLASGLVNYRVRTLRLTRTLHRETLNKSHNPLKNYRLCKSQSKSWTETSTTRSKMNSKVAKKQSQPKIGQLPTSTKRKYNLLTACSYHQG